MLDASVALVREVAQREIIPRFLRVSHGQRKDDGSLCSEADLAAQHFLAERLSGIRPCPVIGEEMPREAQQAGWESGNSDDLGVWCIDPIDGTTNFINGLPCFAVSIAWMSARRTRVAVTYNPITDEMFYARQGNGAYLNGRRLPLRQVTAEIARAVGGVDFKRIPKQLADRIAVAPPFYSQRNFGSSTLDWCSLAAGRLDLYLHGGQMLWDYAAGSLILREAGGHMCTLERDDYDDDAQDVWRRSVIAALDPGVFVAWRDWVRGNCPRGGS
ncbi:inositol monophosphatase family protein [Accumulibacter sp.]|uniref:inositol monophosphatase family protein n=1 Tax=Accumulibacter sp. TaxID=2053492 RepID=UPI0025F59622|nr:inositol monophosphatase family protein [Accumulibacter sp.]MCM8595294.1 inositol monophosphatase family protein [Accumulibacter sp.]MCM8625251.1 inositol monophosphatase family protein [Accumulibacter sp.]MDS4049440.1 inositol monophosphatase family protein [Accumulibacter sp.]